MENPTAGEKISYLTEDIMKALFREKYLMDLAGSLWKTATFIKVKSNSEEPTAMVISKQKMANIEAPLKTISGMVTDRKKLTIYLLTGFLNTGKENKDA